MIYTIENSTFSHFFFFVIGEEWDEKALQKQMNKLSIRGVKGLEVITKQLNKKKNTQASTFFEIPGVTVVYFFRWKNDALDHGAVAHEIFHCVDMMLRERGITLSDDSDETYAYCIGHLTRELYNQMWKEKKP